MRVSSSSLWLVVAAGVTTSDILVGAAFTASPPAGIASRSSLSNNVALSKRHEKTQLQEQIKSFGGQPLMPLFVDDNASNRAKHQQSRASVAAAAAAAKQKQLEEQAEREQKKKAEEARLREQDRLKQQQEEERERQRKAEEARIAEEVRLQEEAEIAAEEARLREEAERATEQARLKEEAEKASEEARLREEAQAIAEEARLKERQRLKEQGQRLAKLVEKELAEKAEQQRIEKEAAKAAAEQERLAAEAAEEERLIAESLMEERQELENTDLQHLQKDVIEEEALEKYRKETGKSEALREDLRLQKKGAETVTYEVAGDEEHQQSQVSPEKLPHFVSVRENNETAKVNEEGTRKAQPNVALKSRMSTEQRQALKVLANENGVELHNLGMHALVAKMKKLASSISLVYTGEENEGRSQLPQEDAVIEAINEEENWLKERIAELASKKQVNPSVLDDLKVAKEEAIMLLILKEEHLAEVASRAAHLDLVENPSLGARLKATMSEQSRQAIRELAMEIGVDLGTLYVQALVAKAQQLSSIANGGPESTLEDVVGREENRLKEHISNLSSQRENNPAVQKDLIHAMEEAILVLVVKEELLAEAEILGFHTEHARQEQQVPTECDPSQSADNIEDGYNANRLESELDNLDRTLHPTPNQQQQLKEPGSGDAIGIANNGKEPEDPIESGKANVFLNPQSEFKKEESKQQVISTEQEKLEEKTRRIMLGRRLSQSKSEEQQEGIEMQQMVEAAQHIAEEEARQLIEQKKKNVEKQRNGEARMLEGGKPRQKMPATISRNVQVTGAIFRQEWNQGSMKAVNADVLRQHKNQKTPPTNNGSVSPGIIPQDSLWGKSL